MPFTGQANATIDAKMRLAIPAKFRNRWDPNQDGATWFCIPWPQTKTLRLYTHSMFNELYSAGRRAPSLTPSPDQSELDSILFSAAEEVDVDANHRIRLPAWQVETLSLPRDIVVIGAGDRLEIRDRESWQASFNDKLARMHEIAEKISSLQSGE